MEMDMAHVYLVMVLRTVKNVQMVIISLNMREFKNKIS